MKYIYFEWDDGNEYKVSVRASIEEIESIFYDKKRKNFRTYFNRYKTIARTNSGRYLFAVFYSSRQAGASFDFISHSIGFAG